MTRNFLPALVLIALIALFGCARQPKYVVVLEWQPQVSEICKNCPTPCGVDEAQVKQAYAALKEKLSAEGIEVSLATRAATPERPSSGVWLCDVPLETWVGGTTLVSPCQHDAKGDCKRRTLRADARNYETIPADLIVRAGLSCADELKEHAGKIDPAAIGIPKGCAGCPSASSCSKAKAGGE